MHSISVTKTLGAPQQAVWDVLADFGNIADWNSGVSLSKLTGDADATAVGTTRYCELKPMGTLDETLLVMDEPSRAVVRIDKATKIPIKHGEVEFLLEPDGDGTKTTINYAYQAKGGPLAGIVGRILAGQLTKGFGGFLDDLGAEAQTRVA